MKKILFATSEAVPFVKTEGWADVAGSLPKYLIKKSMMSACGCFQSIYVSRKKWRQQDGICDSFYDWKCDSTYVGVLKLVHDGITFYFIDNEGYFGGIHTIWRYIWRCREICIFRAVLEYIAIDRFTDRISFTVMTETDLYLYIWIISALAMSSSAAVYIQL